MTPEQLCEPKQDDETSEQFMARVGLRRERARAARAYELSRRTKQAVLDEATPGARTQRRILL